MTLQPAEVALSADLPLPVTVLGLGWVGAAMVARLLDQAAPLEINVRVPSARHLGAWLDLADAAVLRRGHRLLLNDEAAWRRAAVVFHCAGAANPTGVSRHSVAEHNLALTGEVFARAGFAAPPWVIVIANPVDLVAGLLTRLPGLDPARVIGTGTYLDTIRMQREIAACLEPRARGGGGLGAGRARRGPGAGVVAHPRGRSAGGRTSWTRPRAMAWRV